eukprot:TRINITY_DN166_c0_g1_i2.p1 TRINITY_DN166_c0_g1~~TRINITY_DN166_c0_g1_i2.p1  ORF type:complete len:628 (+),score=496.57 TRINITY_DN166_c0_g1_i2:3-1886(+)
MDVPHRLKANADHGQLERRDVGRRRRAAAQSRVRERAAVRVDEERVRAAALRAGHHEQLGRNALHRHVGRHDAEQFLAAEPLALAAVSFHHRLDALAALNFTTLPADYDAALPDEPLRETSVVLLAPRALRRPADAFAGAGDDEPADFVAAVHRYLNDALFPAAQADFAGDGAPLRPGVRGDVKRSAALEAVWRQSLTRAGAPRRFLFATPLGVTRVMPGVARPFGAHTRRYDPLGESWYVEALRAGGSMAVTRPRLDAASDALLVTMSHAVYAEDDDERVLGVSAMDVPHRRLDGVVTRVAQCGALAGRECYLLDSEARFVTPLDGDASTVGASFVERQPSAARALLAAGALRRVLVPDFVSGTVCERWLLAPNVTAGGDALELVASGGCPNGRVWMSAVESGGAGAGGAASNVTRDEATAKTVASLVPPGALVGDAADGDASLDALDALDAPQLYLVMIDAYAWGVGPDCGAELPAVLEHNDTCAPYVAGACSATDFAADAARTGGERLCASFDGLGDRFADELRRSVGAAPGEAPVEVQCAPALVETVVPVPADDTGVWLIIGLVLGVLLLCAAAVVAVCVIKSAKRKHETNVNVEQSAAAAPAGGAAAAGQLDSDSESWEPSE